MRIEVSHLGDDGQGGHRYLVRDNGIGLSTVEKIVKLFGGQIKAYNDKGACFEFAIKDFQQ